MEGKIEVQKRKLLIRKIILTLLLLVTVGFAGACSGNSDEQKVTRREPSNSENSAIKFEKDGELTFLSESGDYITSIDIEIADTEQKRMQGLMFRESMKENRGMLFIFPREDYQAFWMKNTVIPLDMIFVNSKKEIINIHKNTTPFSEQTYPSSGPAIYVIEVNAGFTDKYNIVPGDKIVWRIVR